MDLIISFVANHSTTLKAALGIFLLFALAAPFLRVIRKILVAITNECSALKSLKPPKRDTNGTGDPLSIDDIISQAKSKLWKSTSDLTSIEQSLNDDIHDTITKKVYRRLLLRHSILHQVENLACEHDSHAYYKNNYEHGLLKDGTKPSPPNHGNAKPKIGRISHCISSRKKKSSDHKTTQNNPFSILPSAARIYNISATDLFVEKALTYLAQSEKWHQRVGQICCITAFVIMFSGTVIASIAILPNEIKETILPNIAHDSTISTDRELDSITLKSTNTYFGSNADVIYTYQPDNKHTAWIKLLHSFTRSFTAYGMIIILSMALLKLGRTMLEQYEKISERRHALRQGRLYVHLNNGMLSIEELDKAFNWNESHDNAFSSVKFDAQAPWGKVTNEAIQGITEIGKAGFDTIKKFKGKND